MGALSPPPRDLLKYFDSDLQNFYYKALSKELSVQKRQNILKIRLALNEVVSAYKKEYGNSSSFRFDSSAKRCAYVLKHSPCFTSAVAKHFLKLFCRNSGLLQNCLTSGELNLCCLGGGPASDVVAVSKIISAWYQPYWIQTEQTLKFRVTIVDVNECWEVTARNVLELLAQSPKFFGVEGIELSFRFCKADLTQKMDADVEDILRKSDVLTMVYFLSAVNRGKDTEESLRMIQEIMNCMKSGAFVFFLDSARNINYNQMSAAADISGNLKQIYGPRLEEFHTLSIKSVRTFLDLYKKSFGKLLCMTNCFVSSSAWVKLDNIMWTKELSESRRKIVAQKGHLPFKSDVERAARLTRKMMAFRSRVQQLLADDSESELSDELYDLCDPLNKLSLQRYFECVPDYFFQTKSKKKRIFTKENDYLIPLLI